MSEIKVGVKVAINGKPEIGLATVRFYGPTQFQPGNWVGIELETSEGKNDGSVNNVRYFTCPKNKGLFIRENQLTVVDQTTRQTRSTSSGELIASAQALPMQNETIDRMIQALKEFHVFKGKAQEAIQTLQSKLKESVLQNEKLKDEHQKEKESLERELEALRRELSNIKNNKESFSEGSEIYDKKSTMETIIDKKPEVHEKVVKVEDTKVSDKDGMQNILLQNRNALLQLLSNYDTLSKGLQMLPNPDEVKILKSKLAVKMIELEETKKLAIQWKAEKEELQRKYDTLNEKLLEGLHIMEEAPANLKKRVEINGS